MLPEHEVVHLRHDLAQHKAQTNGKIAVVQTLLQIALEALEVDRPHVAVEKIRFAIKDLDKMKEG